MFIHHRTFSHVLRHNFPSEAAHHTPSQRLRLAESPHAFSRATRGLGNPSPTLSKTPHLQALCVEVSDLRARLATLSSAWSWMPPCHVWSTFARRWNCLVVGVCASKVCTQTALCTFRQALLCSASRDRALVCAGSSCFRRHPNQVINLSTDTIVPASVPAASCIGLALSASASGARSRRSSVRVVSALESAHDTRSRSCSRCVLTVCLVVSGHLAHPASRPVAAREFSHREALRKVLCSPSCSSRAAPVAQITKSSRLTVLCTLSP